MLFRITSYLKFLLKSTNQHGVHSPFVYDVVTKCFYDTNKPVAHKSIKRLYKDYNGKRSINSLKTTKLLNHLSSYFGFTKVAIIDNSSDFVSKVLSIDNSISIVDIDEQDDLCDLIYVNLNTTNLKSLENLFSKTHNNSLIIVSNIYQSKENTLTWKKVKCLSAVRVTIDTYSLGFIFFRKEQVKEHFTIRV